MSSVQQQPSIKQELTDVIEDLPSVKTYICRICRFKFSEEKYLTNHVNLCKNIANPDKRLGVDPTVVKKEEADSMELVGEGATTELTLDIKNEEIELTEPTVTVYGQSIHAPKAETSQANFLHSKYDNAVAQSMCLKEREEVRKPVGKDTDEKPFKCTLCDYASYRIGDLEQHIRTHSGEKPFKCTLCDYASAAKSGLRQHIITHSSEKPFKCTLCDYTCYRIGNLERHIRTHSGEKPFKCTLCDYASAAKSSLIPHMLSHSGEKPFICTLCDYSSAYKPNLTQHIRTHGGEKSFKCTFCDYASVTRGTLTKHMSTHTSDKPFKCALCDYSGALKATLIKHMKQHRG